ncbi:MAG: hypothetical protein HYZ81_21645 [Nitrospinae bacterium]|nr:hypothetical protein [Nitrospinota bacterium]
MAPQGLLAAEAVLESADAEATDEAREIPVWPIAQPGSVSVTVVNALTASV